MKRTAGYRLQRIGDTDYLLPYGQLIADHKLGISLNETGVYIWGLLEKEPTREELRREYLEHFQEDGQPDDDLIRDLDQFLRQLIVCGVVEDDVSAQLPPPNAYLEIGGLKLAMACPRELIDNSFLKDFLTSGCDRPDQRVTVYFAPPRHRTNGVLLVRAPELMVFERTEDYLLLFPTFSQIHEVSVTKDGAEVNFYCAAPVTPELHYQFFHALRLTFLYLAQKRGMYAIHSASILYRDKAWLFSASSGTGKSTHVGLWKKLYQTAILNGDLNLLAIEDGEPVIHGIPWCGTSEVYDKRTLPLGGIILLWRDRRDAVEELAPDQKALLILQRLISPMWSGELLAQSALFAQRLTGKIWACRLHCTKEPSAAKTAKIWIDECLSNYSE